MSMISTVSEVQVPLEYRESHYSTKLWKAYLAYLSRHYDRDLFFETCRDLGMPAEHLLRDDNWVSNQFAHQFVEKLIKKTGNKEIARDAGRMVVSPDTLGPIEYELLQSLGSLFLVFYRFPSEMKWTNRVSQFRTLKIAPGHFKFAMEPMNATLRSSPHVCENLMGALEGGGRLFDADFVIVSENECIHRGASRCVFEARYSTKTLWKRRFILSSALLSAGVFGHWFLPKIVSIAGSWALTGAFWSAYLAIVFAAFVMRSHLRLRQNITQYHDQSHSKARELEGSYRKLDRRYQELNTLNELGLSLVSASGTRDIIDTCLDSLVQRFHFGRCLVMLLNSAEDRLATFRFRGFPEVADKISNFSVAYHPVESKPGLFADILAKGDIKSVFDVESFRKQLKAENQALIDLLKISSLVCCPLQDESEKFGLLIVGSTVEDTRLDQDDVHLLTQVSRVLSIHFKTMKTLESERNAKNVFRKYVPQQVLESLEAGGSQFEKVLRPKNTNICSLFVDIRNFTRAVEHLPPERVVDLLNRYSDFITTRIAEYGGIIDKLVGDEVVGFFVPSIVNQFVPERMGMESALRICSDLKAFNRELVASGFPEISMGLGLSGGPATIGNMGSRLRLNYTAIGDTVNLASRLQSLTKEYFQVGDSAKAILISTRDVYDKAALPVACLSLQNVEIRGRDQREDICVVDLERGASIEVRSSRTGDLA